MVSKKKVGGHVIVRTFGAGVHYGQLVSRAGQDVTLKDARRIWSWQGANTLHEIALRGVGGGSKVSEAVSSIVLTQAMEVIACTDAAVAMMAKRGWGT